MFIFKRVLFALISALTLYVGNVLNLPPPPKEKGGMTPNPPFLRPLSFMRSPISFSDISSRNIGSIPHIPAQIDIYSLNMGLETKTKGWRDNFAEHREGGEVVFLEVFFHLIVLVSRFIKMFSYNHGAA